MDQITLNPPPVVPGDAWGQQVNDTFGAAQNGINALNAAVTLLQAGGFVVYDTVTGWPTVPSDQVRVFLSSQSSSAPQPTGGADGSTWIFKAA